jgi:hypothetical protein
VINISTSCYKILFCIATLHPCQTFANRVASLVKKAIDYAENC